MLDRVLSKIWAPIAVCLIFQACGRAPIADSAEPSENDLVLEMILKSPPLIKVGENIEVDVYLRNRSPYRSYLVVMPGDGSESDWREPYVYFTATVTSGDGAPKPVPVNRLGRCGNFDADWQKDVFELKPCTQVDIGKWIPQPSTMLEFQESGRVQLVAHYSYKAGIGRDREQQPDATGVMGNVAPFELVSAPLDIEVAKPLDLVLSAKSPLIAKKEMKLSELFDIRLVNRSNSPQTISSPTLHADAHLILEIDERSPISRFSQPFFDKENNTQGTKHRLKPGEEVTLIGEGAFSNGMDGKWSHSKPEAVKVRAIYYASTWNPASIIKSNWLEVKVVNPQENS